MWVGVESWWEETPWGGYSVGGGYSVDGGADILGICWFWSFKYPVEG